jgi:hypothetical protein
MRDNRESHSATGRWQRRNGVTHWGFDAGSGASSRLCAVAEHSPQTEPVQRPDREPDQRGDAVLAVEPLADVYHQQPRSPARPVALRLKRIAEQDEANETDVITPPTRPG